MATFRLFLHVTSASVWVGGQVLLTALWPSGRPATDSTPNGLALAVSRVMWPAFLVAAVTGMWSLVLIPLDQLALPWISLKLLAVTATGLAGAVHHFVAGRTAISTAAAAVAASSAVAAVYLGLLVGPSG